MNYSGSYGASELLIKAGANVSAQDTSFGDIRLVFVLLDFMQMYHIFDDDV
jgi:hypothetical protein